MITMLISGAFVGALSAAAFTDLRARRIPNVLTVGGLMVALVLRGLLGDGALLDGLLGLTLGSAVVLPLFALRAIGGGDAKLLMMVGAFLGPKGFFVALLGTALSGGVLALVESARRGALLPVLFTTAELLRYFATLGRRGKRASVAAPEGVTIPYGLAIAFGSFAALYLGSGI